MFPPLAFLPLCSLGSVWREGGLKDLEGSSSKHTCGQGSLKIELISKGQKKTKPQKTNKQKTLKTFIKLSISCLFFPLRNQLIYLQKNPKNNPPKNQNKNLPAQGKAMPSSKRILWVEATRKFQEKWVRKNSLFSLVPSHHISIYSPPHALYFFIWNHPRCLHVGQGRRNLSDHEDPFGDTERRPQLSFSSCGTLKPSVCRDTQGGDCKKAEAWVVGM